MPRVFVALDKRAILPPFVTCVDTDGMSYLDTVAEPTGVVMQAWFALFTGAHLL
jgi:hypothetical protein